MPKKCEKTKFISPERATERLEEIRKSGDKRTHTPRRIYQCEICGHWHLTRWGEKAGKKRRKKLKRKRVNKIVSTARYWANKMDWSEDEIGYIE